MYEWMDRAKCANDLEVQFELSVGYDRFHDGSKGERSKVAKTYCTDCPVKTECLTMAMASYNDDVKMQERVHGVWGGTTETVRTNHHKKIQAKLHQTQVEIQLLQERWKEQFPDTEYPTAS